MVWDLIALIKEKLNTKLHLTEKLIEWVYGGNSVLEHVDFFSHSWRRTSWNKSPFFFFRSCYIVVFIFILPDFQVVFCIQTLDVLVPLNHKTRFILLLHCSCLTPIMFPMIEASNTCCLTGLSALLSPVDSHVPAVFAVPAHWRD